MAILEMKNVSFQYPKSKNYVLKDMSHSFDKGKISALVGSSGSGKSTILMLLAALDNRYTGEILIDNSELKKLNKNSYRAKNVGIIFQSYNLLFQSTALENVMMGLYLSGEKKVSKETATELLEKVGITKEKHSRKCIQLSGGEQQRVAIARALTGNPDILIADEPTGNLDEVNQTSIMEIFSDLAHEENKCVIIATHSAQVVEYADDVISLGASK